MTSPRLSAFLVLCCSLWPSAFGADSDAAYLWKPMKIGGGGWVTGLDISPSAAGPMYARTDVSGAYRRDAAGSSWRQLVTVDSMPPGSMSYGRLGGVESIVGAPGAPDVAYMAYSGIPYGGGPGEIYRSGNRGEAWQATGFRRHDVNMEPNGEGRQDGERLAVDPANSDIVYFGSIADGLWVTRDGGASWARAKDIPAGAPPHGVTTIVFDSSPARPRGRGGETSVIYVTVERAGIYRSDDAGVSWKKISDTGPGDSGRPRDAEIGPDHRYYVALDHADDTAGSVWRFSPAQGWTNITPTAAAGGDKPYWEVAVDPTDADRVVAMISGGRCFVSHDGGASWSFHDFRLTSPDIRWQGRQENYFLSTGELAFDPLTPGRLWYAEGFGVWWTDDLSPRSLEWHSASEGIEEACGNDVIAPPGGKPVAAMWDLGAFYFDDVDAYTAERSQPRFMSAWALDWCASDPRFIAGVFKNHLNFEPFPRSSGYSTDGGRTWTRFAAAENRSLPADLDYGVIAVSANDPNRIVWAPDKGRLPYFTADRGATWTRCVFEGADSTSFRDFPNPQKALCSDRVRADTFYLFIAEKGVFRSTDGGASFSKAGHPLPWGGWNAVLKAAPGRAGDLWLAAGGNKGGLFHSTDGGDSWSTVEGLHALNVGFGKPHPDKEYPTLFVVGSPHGRHGIYRSTDKGETWTRIGDYPRGIVDWIDAIDGDKDVFGKVYVAFAGAGFAYGVPSDPPGRPGPR